MKRLIDLRSDTVTLPPDAMRRAMHEAELGDDVYGEDPTVNALQEKAAERLGKQAGLLVTSGTQGNLASLLSHAGRGDHVLVGHQSHIFKYEAGAASVLGGLFLEPLTNREDGTFGEEQITAAVNPPDVHRAPTRVLAIENTHNLAGGAPVDAKATKRMAETAHAHGLKVHLDGARLFNAAVAFGTEAAALAEPADSVSVCLSKGLGCPLGSVVVGDDDFIGEARRWRKMLGGGMRQAGVVAAAGIYALDHMVDRLAEDHENARRLAYGLAEIQGIVLDPEAVRTNIIYFQTEQGISLDLAKRLEKRGILMDSEKTLARLVTHDGISSADIDLVLLAFAEALR
ncbi:MAG: low-specificity L-threonine aldolase [Gammaproteobacteria bacterium]|nr:low-specificity L-threonine aldolase [Gammaproteobacteria bacterium]